jgi:hypothetical protein
MFPIVLDDRFANVIDLNRLPADAGGSAVFGCSE